MKLKIQYIVMISVLGNFIILGCVPETGRKEDRNK